MIIGLIAAIGLASFSGGNANEFAKFVADSTHQNVVFYQSVVEDVAKVDFDAADINEMARTFRAKLAVQMAPGVRLILSDGLIEPERLAPAGTPRSEPVWVSLPDEALKDGKVTWRTRDRDRLNPGTLAQAHFSRPVKVHWFFHEVPVAVAVKDMPEQEFLTYVAKAVGGRLIVSPKEYNLDFDAGEVRTRAIKRMRTWPKKWKPQANEDSSWNEIDNRFIMTEKVLAAAPLNTLYEAFETEKSQSVFPVSKTSSVVSTFLDLIKGQLKNDPDTNTPGFQLPSGFLHLPEALDEDKAVDVKLTAKFGCTLTCHAGKLDGKPLYFSFSWTGN